MATYNPNLENLNLEEILSVSERYLLGWHDLIADGHGFRLKGLNRKRCENGLEPLTKEMSNEYRIKHIRSKYSQDEIDKTITEYLRTGRVGDDRWTGIELFGCRFGREYATLFRALMGSAAYRKAGETARVAKLTETQVNLYGGVGLSGGETKAKAKATVQLRYGVDNVMQADIVKNKVISPFTDLSVRDKAQYTKWKHIQDAIITACDTKIASRLLKSKAESVAYLLLTGRFGRSDVFYEYGIHPSDKRYPHNCDFYIKSLDLFIEMHCHYSHGGHWFDPGNKDDVLRLSHLAASDSKRSRMAARTWTDVDLKKRHDARRSGIKYLVFWDGTTKPAAEGGIPNLSDFYDWFYDYDCDYDRFIADHPENTY